MKTYEIYRSSDIASAWGDKQGSALQSEEDCRIAMIFVAMLAGGDYVPQGLDAFGEFATRT
jgi:Holliday junction resolvase YEN1